MPRPKPPQDPAWVERTSEGFDGDPPRNEFSLTTQQKDYLAELLFGRGNPIPEEIFRSAVWGLEFLQNWHFEKSLLPNPGATVAALSTVLAAQQRFMQTLADLDYETRELLEWFGFWDAGGDWWETGAEASELWLQEKIAYVQSQISAGRPRNQLLRKTAQSIKKYYDEFHGPEAAPWRTFVSEVLTMMGVTHPDPSDQRSRFDELFAE